MSLFLGWSKEIKVKFKSDYKLILLFDKVSFYPVSALLKLYLVSKEEKVEVNSIESMKDRVYIEDEEQALDFVRLFTNPDLHVFFDLLAIEVFKKSENPFDPYGSIDDKIFEGIGLVKASVTKDKDSFVVRRNVLFYPDSEGVFPRKLAIVREYVKNNGEYYFEVEKEIKYENIDEIRMPIE
ncbi:MAG: hypothetical protein ACK4GJ_00615 [bacterium]